MFNPYKKKLMIVRPTRTNRKLPQFKIRRNGPVLSDWIGDNMQEHPEPTSTRFLLQNCHGLPLLSDTNFFKSKITDILVNDIHFMSLPEINVNCLNVGLTNGYKEAFSQLVPDGVFTTTNTPIFEKEHRYQPGGVASGFFGKLVTRYVSQKSDKYGRWHYHEFNGRDQNLRIYTLYRTNYSTDATAGGITAWMQQRLVLQQDGNYTNPRQSVVNEFLNEITATIELGVSVIVMTDLNEHVDGNEATNERFINSGLINLFQEKIGNDLPRTFKRGQKAIDHIYMTPNVYPYVLKAGMAPFDFCLKSDHRALLFDLNLNAFLDPEINVVQPYHRRRLKATVPDRMKKYIDALSAKWEEHKIDQRIQRIEEVLIKTNHKDQLEKELNDVDELITGLMRYAEKKCAKTGKHHTLPWSPDLHYGILHVRTCTEAVKEALYLDPTKSLAEQIRTYQDAEVELRKAKESYLNLKAEAQKIRDQFMEEKIEYHNAKTGMAPKAILKSLKHIEEQQRNSTKIGFALQRNQRRGITSVLIPAKEEYESTEQSHYREIPTMWNRIERASGKDIDKWETICKRGELEEILVDWQRQHFRQAGETPLSTNGWRRKFIDEETQNQILDGTFEITEDLPDECREIIEYQRWNQKTKNKVKHDTTPEAFIDFIKKAKEKSSCSPSGRTYSHYKTLVDKPAILRTIHRLFSLALDNDIILNRWSQTITTLIPKDEGPIYVHRLRAIHVVEAELQFFSKLVYAKRMIPLAEKTNSITDEQYGGRQGRRAQSIVLNKLLYYSISHQTKETAAFLDDDAKACYDRILPSLAGVETRKWGLTHKATDLTRKIIESQTFQVKTAHGTSQATYTYNENDQTFGVGQGLGWSGAIWMASSNTICEIMKDKCGGMRFESPDKSIVVEKRGDLFVDDTALGTTENCTRNNNTVIEQIKHDGQKHALTLFSEGHRLSLPKCSWYLAAYARSGTKHRHKMIHEAPGTLELQEGFNMPSKTVKRLEPFNMHKTLGNYLSIDGKQTGQFRFMKSKITTWAARVRTSGLSGSNKILAYNGYLIPSLAYRLATSSLTFKQCKELQSIIDPILLHAYGLQRNLPKIVIFSTTSKAGLGIIHLYHLQGLEKLKLFLMHLRRDDTTGDLIRISMAYTQLEIGIETFFLQKDYYTYKPFLTETWITHLWQYLCDCNATIEATDQAQYQVPRENDRYFMELIYSSPLTILQKEIVNQIRMQLKILTLADIVAVGSPDIILSPIYHGKQIRQTKWNWPKIADYPKDWLEIWQSALSDIITPHLNNNPLGRWIGDSHQKWKFSANHDGNFITDGQTLYERYTTTRLSKFIPTSVATDCPFRADVTDMNGSINLLSWNQRETVESQERDDRDPEWMTQNWGTTIDAEKKVEIANCLRNATLMAVSDGSVNKNKAGQAWTLVNEATEENIITGTATVNGEGEELCSNRAEMFGLLASLTCVEKVAKEMNVTSGTLTMYTDSTNSIRKSLNKKLISTKDILKLDNDITFELQSRIQKVPFKVKIIHVKGHQDSHQEYEELTLEAQLNCQMDHKVNNFMEQNPAHSNEYPILPHQRYCIRIAGDVTPNRISQKLIDHYNDDAWATYLTKRLGIEHSSICKVDWMPMQKIINTPKLKGSYVKNFHNELNTMERCKLWKTAESSKCPLCKKKKETWQHVLKCKNEHSVRTRRDARNHIEEILVKEATHVSIKKLFLHILDQWTLGKTPKKPIFQNPDPIEIKLESVFHSQKEIGWDAFMKGILSSSWKEIQQEDYDGQRISDKFSSTKWSKSVVSALFKYNHMLWKNRCEIVHIENKETLEKRKRQQLKNVRDRLVKKPWKLRNRDRHLLERNDEFFSKDSIQSLEIWEQLVFVALEQQGQLNESNDIRKYGTLRQRTNHRAPATPLQPTQTIGRYRQTKLQRTMKSKGTTPTRTKTSSELREKQHQIEEFLAQGSRNSRVPPEPTVNLYACRQLHIRDFFVNTNSTPHGHRGMACGPHVGATHKINSLIN